MYYDYMQFVINQRIKMFVNQVSTVKNLFIKNKKNT